MHLILSRKVFSTQDELLNCPRYMLFRDSPSPSSSSATSPTSSPTLGRRTLEGEEEEEEQVPIVPRSGTHRTHHHHHHRHRHHHLHRHHHPEPVGVEPLNNDELEACISQLRGILGEETSTEELRRIALAADFDLNRAINFFFSN
jgi:hypothetical protein